MKKATKADEDGEDGEGRAYIWFILLLCSLVFVFSCAVVVVYL